jgi:hypothetical protein
MDAPLMLKGSFAVFAERDTPASRDAGCIWATGLERAAVESQMRVDIYRRE